jgi:hypothetical protein
MGILAVLRLSLFPEICGLCGHSWAQKRVDELPRLSGQGQACPICGHAPKRSPIAEGTGNTGSVEANRSATALK